MTTTIYTVLILLWISTYLATSFTPSTKSATSFIKQASTTSQQQSISLHATALSSEQTAIPITILSGFLGSGKSTLISHLLKTNPQEKTALLDNDAEAIRIDTDLASFPLSENIWSSLEEVLTLSDLREDGGYNRILMECSGTSDPDTIRHQFQEMPRLRLESMVTVVDASTFQSNLRTPNGIAMKESPELYSSKEKKDMPAVPSFLESLGLEEEKSEGVAHRFISQMEIADVILINKCDLISEETSSEIEEIVTALNPNAVTIPTKFGEVKPNQIYPEHDPDYVTVADLSTPDDHRLLIDSTHRNSQENAPRNIGSFVYTARKPFHPIRWSSFLLEYLKSDRSIIRSRGFTWLANSHTAAMYWSHATTHYEIRRLGGWWATLNRDEWPEEALPVILSDFDSIDHTDQSFPQSVGDRRQEIVFVGSRDMNREEIAQGLDSCLLNEDEYSFYVENAEEEDALKKKFGHWDVIQFGWGYRLTCKVVA